MCCQVYKHLLTRFSYIFYISFNIQETTSSSLQFLFDSWMGNKAIVKLDYFLSVIFFSPQRSDGEGIVQLDGEGYSAVGRPTRWNPNISTVTFKFRTFSSESLLMYLATEDMVCMQQSERE